MQTSSARFSRIVVLLACLALAITISPAASEEYVPPHFTPPSEMQQWLASTEHQKAIAPGTTINNSNWQQYKEEMSYGLQMVFSGNTSGRFRRTRKLRLARR